MLNFWKNFFQLIAAGIPPGYRRVIYMIFGLARLRILLSLITYDVSITAATLLFTEHGIHSKFFEVKVHLLLAR